MPITLKIQKLDRRYDGHDRFTHRVHFVSRDRNQWSLIRIAWVHSRQWLWQNFGPSAELNLAYPEFFDGEQPKWAWDHNKSALYLKDETLSMFLLKKELWENG